MSSQKKKKNLQTFQNNRILSPGSAHNGIRQELQYVVIQALPTPCQKSQLAADNLTLFGI